MKVEAPQLGRTFWAIVATAAILAVSVNAAAQPIEFNRDVRPILTEACIACHGPDSAARQADLRLDRREDALDTGAIVAGDPDASEMIRRVLSEDESEVMPPPESKKSLTDEQVAVLKQWVQEGAEYQSHWSFIAPVRPDAPKASNRWWARNEIDAFVAARLEAEGLRPAPEADKRTLLRRVTLDLTGLPPTPEEIDAFLDDSSPGAYERVVDRLLASPRWGEHRGRYWLDLARYGDTHGIHIDNYREIWPYREWVINAFNANLPFNEFTRKNLAGDLLPNASLDDRVASGFNRCNITTGEGGAIDAEYAVLYTRDRVETTATAWMGLTAGCAVCHDHKYDPLTQKEFYSLAAFFNNTTQPAMDGNLKDTPPVVTVYSAEDRKLHADFTRKRDELEAAMAKKREAARTPEEAQESLTIAEKDRVPGPVVKPTLVAPLDEGVEALNYRVLDVASKAKLEGGASWQNGPWGRKSIQPAGKSALTLPEFGDFEGDTPFTVTLWMQSPLYSEPGALVSRMGGAGWDLWWESGRLSVHLINSWPKNAIKVFTRGTLPRNRWFNVAVTYDGSRKASGFKIYADGVLQPHNVEADTLTESIRTDAPFSIGSRNGTSGVKHVQVTQLRVYDKALSPEEVELARDAWIAEPLARPFAERTDAEKDAVVDWRLRSIDADYAAAAAGLVACREKLDSIAARSPVTHVMQERDAPPTAQILRRGEYDQPGDTVTPDVPAMLPPLAAEAPRNRLGFADWLLSPEHPLTARVTVNRCWQELFGTGIVRTSGDFGQTGELPSHPELLDWLAVDFRESGWDIKRLYRQMVTSATYRQSAAASPESFASDPENRLLARGPRFRLDAETIRDQALAVSGLLVERVGGPSVKPYQPDGIWEAVTMPGSDTYKYFRDNGDALYRRSMYTFWKRAAPPASLETLNAPSREACTVKRERTNTPMQALVTLNDPQFVEAARVLAERAIEGGGPEPADRLRWIAQRLLGRPLSQDESRVALDLADAMTKDFAGREEDAKQLLEVGETPSLEVAPAAEVAAWTMVASAVMNLDESLNK